MNDMIRKWLNIIFTGCGWFFVILCLLMTLGCGVTVSSLLFLVSGILALPIKPIKQLWKKLLIKGGWLKSLILAIVFIVAICLLPPTESQDINNNTESESQTEYDSEMESESESEKETESETESNEPTESESKTPTQQELETESDKSTEIESKTTVQLEIETKTDEPTETERETSSQLESETGPTEPIETERETSSQLESETEPAEPIETESKTSAQTELDQETETNQPIETKNYAVNSKNGKIHIVGECFATGNGDNAMTDPVYFDTQEEALAYSKKIAPNEKKPKCGNCW